VFISQGVFFDLELGIKDGKIAMLGSPGSAPEAVETIDAAGNFVIPGVIDPHTHLGIFGDFGMECDDETRAALAGGVTTAGVFMGGGESYLSQQGLLRRKK